MKKMKIYNEQFDLMIIVHEHVKYVKLLIRLTKILIKDLLLNHLCQNYG